jgi:hypothetical protein
VYELDGSSSYLHNKPDASGDNGITAVQLVLVGGDINGSKLIKTAFTSLNTNDAKIKLKNENVLYLYEQLKHRTIIFDSVIENSSSSDDDEDG